MKLTHFFSHSDSLTPKRFAFAANPALASLSNELQRLQTKLTQEQEAVKQSAASRAQFSVFDQTGYDALNLDKEDSLQTLSLQAGEISSLSKALVNSPQAAYSHIDLVGGGRGKTAPELVPGAKLLVLFGKASITLGGEKFELSKKLAKSASKVDIRTLKSGNSTLVSLSCEGEDMAVLNFEGSELKGYSTNSLKDSTRPFQIMKLNNGVRMLPFGNLMITQAGANTPQIEDLGHSLPAQFEGSVSSDEKLQLLKFVEGSQQVAISVDDRGAVSDAIVGPSVFWSKAGQVVIHDSAQNEFKVYEANLSNSSGPRAVLLDDPMMTRLTSFADDIKTILADETLTLEDRQTRISSLDAPENVGETLGKQIVEFRGKALHGIGIEKANEGNLLERQTKDRAEVVKLRDKLLQDVQAMVDNPPALDNPSGNADIDERMKKMDLLKEIGKLRRQFNQDQKRYFRDHSSGSLGETDKEASENFLKNNVFAFEKDIVDQLMGAVDETLNAFVVLSEQVMRGSARLEVEHADAVSRGVTMDKRTVDLYEETVTMANTVKKQLEKLETLLRSPQFAVRKRLQNRIKVVTSSSSCHHDRISNGMEVLQKVKAIAIDSQALGDAQEASRRARNDLMMKMRELAGSPAEDFEELEGEATNLFAAIMDEATTKGLGSHQPLLDELTQLETEILEAIKSLKESAGNSQHENMADLTRKAQTGMDRAMNLFKRAKSSDQINELMEGITLRNGKAVIDMDSTNTKSVRIARALQKAQESSQPSLERKLVDQLSSALANARGSVYQLENMYDGDVFQFVWEGAVGKESIPVPLAEKGPKSVKLSKATWAPASRAMKAHIPGLLNTRMKGADAPVAFTIPETEAGEGLQPYLEYADGDTIITAETITYRLFQEHWKPQSQPDEFAKSPFSALLQNLSVVADKNDREQILTTIMNSLQGELKGRYPRVVDEMELRNCAQYVIQFLKACLTHGDTADFDAIAQSSSDTFDIQDLQGVTEMGSLQKFDRTGKSLSSIRQDFQSFNKTQLDTLSGGIFGAAVNFQLPNQSSRLEQLDKLHATCQEFERHLMEEVGLDLFHPEPENTEDYIIGGLQWLRAQRIMTARNTARDSHEDMRGYVLAGQPGCGKTHFQHFLEAREGGKSVWIDANEVREAVSWDPWDTRNAACKAALIKVFFALTNGWNLTVDEAHNLPEHLMGALKTIAHRNGSIKVTQGSPKHGKFGQVFPAGDYRVDSQSVMVLLMNHKRTIGADGRLERIKTSDSADMSTDDALFEGRFEFIDLDRYDLHSQESRDETVKDYMRRMCLAEGYEREFLKKLVDTAVKNPAAGCLKEADFPGYNQLTLNAIEKKVLRYYKGAKVVMEIQYQVLKNGATRLEIDPPAQANVAQEDPTCYMTSVGPRTLSALKKVLDVDMASDQVDATLREFFVKKHASKPETRYQADNIAQIDYIINPHDAHAQVTYNDMRRRHIRARERHGATDQGAIAIHELKADVMEHLKRETGGDVVDVALLNEFLRMVTESRNNPGQGVGTIRRRRR